LQAWLTRLEQEGTVVLYDRSTTSGWLYVPRRIGVDRDLIREPEPPRLADDQGSGVTTTVRIVYSDGRTVPFDAELLR
jgi:hypothetical protein